MRFEPRSCRAARLTLQRCAVKSAAHSAKLGPLPARRQHGQVELVPETIKDSAGRPSQPYKSVDVVEGLLARGIIDSEAALAADRFKRAFRVAALDTLRAADLSRIPGGSHRGFDPPVWARKHVHAAIDALGGQRSLVASCLYHVIGLEWSVRRWSREQAGIAHPTAAGILIAALVLLAARDGRRPAA